MSSCAKFFYYPTTKEVLIQNKKLGCLRYTIQLGIFELLFSIQNYSL